MLGEWHEYAAPRKMTLEDCLSRIDDYLAAGPIDYGAYSAVDTSARFLNVQNIEDLKKVKEHLSRMDGQVFKAAESVREKDWPPSAEWMDINLRHACSGSDKPAIVFGLTSQLMLGGVSTMHDRPDLDAFRDHVRNIAFHSNRPKTVFVCYRCEDLLANALFDDPRLAREVYRVKGEKSELPKVLYASPEISLSDYPLSGPVKTIDGIEGAAEALEETDGGTLVVRTKRQPWRWYSSELVNQTAISPPAAAAHGNDFKCSIGLIGKDNAYLRYLGIAEIKSWSSHWDPQKGVKMETLVSLPADELAKALGCSRADLACGDGVRLQIDDSGKVLSAQPQNTLTLTVSAIGRKYAHFDRVNGEGKIKRVKANLDELANALGCRDTDLELGDSVELTLNSSPKSGGALDIASAKCKDVEERIEEEERGQDLGR